MQGVSSELAGEVRWIRFSRPAVLNALTLEDLASIQRWVTDPGTGTRALVFTGTGDRAFSAGMHIDTFGALDVARAREVIGAVRDALACVRTSPLPTAAMINGYCLGAAFELALTCDVRICADGAQFGLPEVKVGIPSVADAALLQQHVGLALAKELILTGDLYPAAALFQRGLLNSMVPAGQLQTATETLISRITRHTAAVIASQKRLFEIWQNTGLREGAEASVAEFAGMFAAPETSQQISAYRAALRRPAGARHPGAAGARHPGEAPAG